MALELRRKMILAAKKKVREVFTGRDFHIQKASKLVEDLDDIFNLLSEHSREWYSTYFPELNAIVSEHEPFLRIVSQVNSKKNYSLENLLKAYNNEKKASEIVKALRESMGAELSDEDLKQIKLVAENALSARKQRLELESYLEKTMQDYCPNIKGIAGTLIGARLLSQGGGLKKMALLPSSTIQLLGAEKALFKHLRTGAKPPKYGILFQHPLVRQGQAWQKGKIARALAAKISIAARQDYFGEGKKLIFEDLQRSLNEKMKEIQRKQPTEPKRAPAPLPEKNKMPFKPFNKFRKR